MNYESTPSCAREFLETAKQDFEQDPQTALLEVRRFANHHDTAEFTTTPRVVIACRLGGCSVTLTQNEGELSIDAPLCARQRALTN